MGREHVDAAEAEGKIQMTYTMFDHLRVLNDVLTGSGVVLALGGLFVCFKLLVVRTPVTGHLPA
jgi:hypothetical protein